MEDIHPRVTAPTRWGDAPDNFWLEYPSGLVDLSRTHLNTTVLTDPPPEITPASGLWDVPLDGGRTGRLDPKKSALVIVDMQNFFLHPDIMPHPTGLAAVEPILRVLPTLRAKGVHIIWLNWGLTDTELAQLPPAVRRTFTLLSPLGPKGFGAEMDGNFGRLLMRGERNTDLYPPLRAAYEEGLAQGTDTWVHKNRISGLWGQGGTALDVVLAERGIKTLFFAGVNADQCVNGTMVDASFKGYDCIVIRDTVATTSPDGAIDNVYYNCNLYAGFTTDSEKVASAM
ncbi:Isochorismatase hydrolase [Exidia glandulosa HHB12029]|uniref:Isochorismatase hydrolase n=1 Tax=Exidia glandulosa HHB12029 TaxID=1314781 RepID=A0A165K182_EXIGL|nr:Isochorismatase hydrolase [Exidia glandulosa HHB12029]